MTEMNITLYVLLTSGGLSVLNAAVTTMLLIWDRPKDRAIRRAWTNVTILALTLGVAGICVALILIGLKSHSGLVLVWSFIASACLVRSYHRIRLGGFRPERPQPPAPPSVC